MNTICCARSSSNEQYVLRCRVVFFVLLVREHFSISPAEFPEDAQLKTTRRSQGTGEIVDVDSFRIF